MTNIKRYTPLRRTPLRRVNKYGAKASTCALLAGRRFDSQGERNYATQLAIRERVGEISELRCQDSVDLVAGIKWRVDFSYIEDGERVWCEFKGFEDPTYRLKLKLYRVFGPGKLIIVKSSGGKPERFRVTETIWPKG